MLHDSEYAICGECNFSYHFECSINEVNYRKLKKGTWKCTYCRTTTRSRLNPNVDTQNNETYNDVSRKDIVEIRDILATIQKEISDLNGLRTDMFELKHSIDFMSKQYDSVLSQLKEQKDQVNNLTKTVNKLQLENEHKNSEILQLNETIASLDQYMRNRNIEIAGLPEVHNEDCRSVVLTIAKEIGIDIDSSEIDAAHRVPTANKNNPKPIIAQFVTRQKRNLFLEKRQLVITNNNIANTKLGQKVYFNEHLSPYFKNLIKQTKLRAQQANFKYVWFRNGRVLVREGDGRPVQRITNEQHIKDIFDCRSDSQ